MAARQINLRWRKLGLVSMAAVLLLGVGLVDAARIKDVKNTRHNLSTTGTGSVKATTETETCLFCHTAHGATTGAIPLWNRAVPNPATYTGYSSSSMDAPSVQGSYTGQPGGSSKLCLSCHDGTLALGNVNIYKARGSATPGTQTITMTGGPNMPVGSGATTGYTRNLGTDLTGDHPISVDYTATIANRDGELNVPDANQRWPQSSTNPNIIVGIRDTATRPGDRPKLPLEKSGSGIGQVQCGTCHDPHLRETDATLGNQKFLRNNRFQQIAPTPAYSAANDQNCIACHEKDNGAVGAWVYSAHANPSVATQTYTAAATSRREFPTSASYNKVWNAACLNCHDTHTVQGATRLLREGVSGALSGGSYAAGGYRSGGTKAQENTCYQCHTVAASSAITSTAPLIDIEGEMKGTGVGAGNIVSHPNVAATETHNIGGNFNDSVMGGAAADCTSATNKCGADGMESRTNLGVGNLANRHAECADCHHPHRMAKVQKISDAISGAGYVAGGAHRHENAAGYVHDNIASGVLRGTWGVEPTYSSASFHALPSGYTVKRGDPGAAPSTLVTASYVTREYQVCLKCHSDYGYTDDNVYPSGTQRPLFGGSRLTAANTNGRTNYTRYTNQAKEFQAPVAHRGEFNTLNLGTAAGSENNTANARSWHPVIGPTGRSAYGRYLPPWSNAGARGTQTMYCSDCHGSISASTSVIPDNRNPTGAHTATSEGWGPHGGANNMMLKGVWTNTTASNTANNLCFNCHCATDYFGTTTATCAGSASGFSGRGHTYDEHNHSRGRTCMMCHTPVVHGWKNKNFLINLNDIGPEAGLAIGTDVATAYSDGPYYANARLRILTWRNSGSWGNKSECQNVNSH